MLKQSAYKKADVVTSFAEAARKAADKAYALCIFCAPKMETAAVDLAAALSQKAAQVILIVRAEYYEEIAHKVEGYGVMVLPRPLSKTLLYNAVKIAEAVQVKLKTLRDENLALAQKLEEIKLINRAKYVIMQALSLSENDAHKYIEKQSMDRRIGKLALAKEILDNYQY
ncbi:MAG: ANTAR domain-containing protein [Clostridiales bacterium]|jgi:response regulator NasT|nr:ANTAR domain-containing protein [Clostridiales bacterium]